MCIINIIIIISSSSISSSSSSSRNRIKSISSSSSCSSNSISGCGDDGSRINNGIRNCLRCCSALIKIFMCPIVFNNFPFPQIRVKILHNFNRHFHRKHPTIL